MIIYAMCPVFVDETAGTLKLNNLSSNMSGKYMCISSNSAGEESCYYDLNVITCMYISGSSAHCTNVTLHVKTHKSPFL